MRKILLAGVVAALAVGAVPASAHPNYHYEGGCGFQTLSDGGEDDQTTWTGSAQAAVVATDAAGLPAPTATISVECHVYKDGVYQNTILSASGQGAAATASEYEYQASPSAVITVCDVVTVNDEVHNACEDATTTPIVPEPVQEIIEGVFETVDPIIIDAINTVNELVVQHLDPLICAVLKLLAPGFPPYLVITPEGDVYIDGVFFWDCPPYATP